MTTLKHILIALSAAILLVFAGCQTPEPDLSFPTISVQGTGAVSLEKAATSFPVLLMSNRPWKATSDVPWIAFDPDSGRGGTEAQTVTVTVLENTSYDRTATITFDCVYDSRSIAVSQTGTGRPEDFMIYFNDFDKAAATQSYGTSGTAWPYLDQFDGWKNELGVGIEGMTYAFSNVSARNNSNSNGTYSDYAGSGLNNLLFSTNGYIAVKNLSLGSFKNFKLTFGTEKYDANNKTALFDPAELPFYVSAGAQKWVPLTYEYKGTAAGRWNIAEAVFSVPEEVTTLSLYVTAKLSGAYRLDDLKLEVSEEAGTVLDFSQGTEIDTGGGQGGGGGDTPSGGSGSGTLSDPYNPAGAAAAVANLTWTSNTDYQKTEKVYVKGKISRIANNGTFGQSGTYGNASFYISADGTGNGEFYVFRTLYFGGEKYTSGIDIKIGDEVVVYGALMNYRGNTPETVAGECQMYSINGATSGDGGQGGGGGDTPSGGSGSGTLSDPYTPAGATAAVAGLTWTSNTDYQKTEKVYVKGKISRIANNGTFGQSGTYGNASFYISADGTGNGEFYVFRTLYFGGEKYTSGIDIKIGDEVVVYGALMNYRGNTPETVAGECQMYSINGATSGDGGSNPGGGDNPGGGVNPPTGDSVTWTIGAANQTWTAATDPTYGAGFSATENGLTIGYYKHKSSSTAVAAQSDHIRIYKGSHLSIKMEGKTITGVVITCKPQSGTSKYCWDMPVADGSTAKADESNLTVTWTGSASSFEADATNGQIRATAIQVFYK